MPSAPNRSGGLQGAGQNHHAGSLGCAKSGVYLEVQGTSSLVLTLLGKNWLEFG